MIKNNIYAGKLRDFENSIFDVGDSGVCWLQPILSMCIKREDWFFRIIAQLKYFKRIRQLKSFSLRLLFIIYFQ